MFIPYGDDSEPERPSYATGALIALNVLVYLLLRDPLTLARAVLHFGLIPAHLSAGGLLFSSFLHGGFLHLAGNMLFLWIAGRAVEGKLGAPRFLALYFGTGLAADVAHIVANLGSEAPAIGASGAISGIVGAYAILCGERQVKVFYMVSIRAGTFEVPAAWAVALWFLGQVFWAIIYGTLPVQSGIAHDAHIGGAIAGGIVGMGLVWSGAVRADPSADERFSRTWRAAAEAARAGSTGTDAGTGTGTAGGPPRDRSDEIAAAIDRLLRSPPPLGTRERHDVVLLAGDDRSVGRATACYAALSGETALDVRSRLVRTGVIASDLSARAAAAAVEALRSYRLAAVALVPDDVAPLAVTVRLARVVGRAIEGVAGLDAKAVSIPLRDVEAAEAAWTGDDTPPDVEVLAGGRRWRLRMTTPEEAVAIARALASRTTSPLSVGRALRVLAHGRRAGALRDRPAHEIAHGLGCLAALARAASAGEDVVRSVARR